MQQTALATNLRTGEWAVRVHRLRRPGNGWAQAGVSPGGCLARRAGLLAVGILALAAWQVGGASAGGVGSRAAPVDDATIRAELLERGEALRDQGRLVAMAELGGQLGRVLDAPVQVPAASGGDSGDAAALWTERMSGILVVARMYQCPDCKHWHASVAGGFFLTADGVFATSYHVVAEQEGAGLLIRTVDGRVAPVVEVLASDEAHDIAVLRAEGSGYVPLPLQREVSPGDRVRVISHPDSRFYAQTEGIVSRFYVHGNPSMPKRAVFMAITADFARGSSGAPVFNDAGEVVGMVKSTDSIYYVDEGHRQENLQMVFKSCVPATALLELLSGTED